MRWLWGQEVVGSRLPERDWRYFFMTLIQRLAVNGLVLGDLGANSFFKFLLLVVWTYLRLWHSRLLPVKEWWGCQSQCLFSVTLQEKLSFQAFHPTQVDLWHNKRTDIIVFGFAPWALFNMPRMGSLFRVWAWQHISIFSKRRPKTGKPFDFQVIWVKFRKVLFFPSWTV